LRDFPFVMEISRVSPSVTLSIRGHTTRGLALAGLFSFTHFKGRAEELKCAEIYPLSWKSREFTAGDTQYSRAHNKETCISRSLLFHCKTNKKMTKYCTSPFLFY